VAAKAPSPAAKAEARGGASAPPAASHNRAEVANPTRTSFWVFAKSVRRRKRRRAARCGSSMSRVDSTAAASVRRSSRSDGAHTAASIRVPQYIPAFMRQ
ncbi:uncharacterized protein Tco025E_07770, partial [Trypanosoma conorhini]